MSVRFVLSVIIVSMGLVAAVLPPTKNSSVELDARQLLNELQLQNHVISIDEMADALINNDPEYQLIDLRSAAEFRQFSIPGAMNIPFDSLFSQNWLPYVDQVARKNVFYSNGTTLSSEAWMLTRQRGFQNNYILQGGLNNWYARILYPVEPAATEGEEAFSTYKARLGARQFFTGEGAASAATSNQPRKPVPRRKKKMVAGGCS